jgi:cytochrome c oxidase cbb3-type subunit 3
MKKLIPSYKGTSNFSLSLVQWSFIDSGEKPAFIKYPMVSLFLMVFFILINAVEITISA